jgi:carbamoyl-phosphate synthase small subunit
MQAESLEARLVMEDGSVWVGRHFGASGTRLGEVVFNTSMTGYQEILTDPSYAGQMVVMTASQIGNTGINQEDHEAHRAFLRCFIIRELSPCVSNWRAVGSLPDWLVEQNIIAVEQIDTRALTSRIRKSGAMKGILTTEKSLSCHLLTEKVRSWPGISATDLVREVTCETSYAWEEASDERWMINPQNRNDHEVDDLHVVVYDYGVKRNILRRLAANGPRITVVPATMPAEEILALHPDGVLLSNGPGDPAILDYAVESTRRLLGQVPIFGICLGHQILGQALGGQTFKLKFGHHGGNQPVKHVPSGRIEISAHNHNFAVDPDTLPEAVEITHINLNDGCCEGMRHKALPALSIQYHPEAAPGPHDADPLFTEFIKMMRSEKDKRSA